ncbi:hypothetical protein MPSEU_001039100 [Mayamaea pseudoterrestris]|nr:hypothetical protein MPSEU_001039100 [Mayamaea pseudoterrestris]
MARSLSRSQQLVILLPFACFGFVLHNDLNYATLDQRRHSRVISCSKQLQLYSQREDDLRMVDELIAKHCIEVGKGVADRNADYLRRVDSLHASDVSTARQSILAMETLQTVPSLTATNNYCFEWMDDSSIAIQSLEPVLSNAAIHKIRTAANTLFQLSQSTTSRFTYQFNTNAEAHVADLLDALAIAAINDALATKIYPMVRAAFMSESPRNDTSNESNTDNPLFVYDALFIRYNATSGATAGQPFHRDLGLVSVNIMLNEEFDGGGTYFENQMQETPLQPSGGVGHCIAHYSNERHAGASTVAGIRDILVLFLSTVKPEPVIRNARLKQCRSYCETTNKRAALWCRIVHQRLAISMSPSDGEAYQYLGTALMELARLDCSGSSPNDKESRRIADGQNYLHAAIVCLQIARTLTPNDARVYNNLGLATGRALAGEASATQHAVANVDEIYEKCLQLLLQQSECGCNVQHDLFSLSLNYGLHLANQDRFSEAAKVLRHAAYTSIDSRTRDDANRLLQFCLRQC